MNENNTEKDNLSKKRFLSIDTFKGLAVILMIFANTLSINDNVPAWSKHADEFGLTYVDLIAPFFVFILALNFLLSFKRRILRNDIKSVYFHFIKRYMIILGIGMILYIDPESTIFFRWGLLQALGISGLILLVFIKLKAIIRLLVGGLLILIHQFIVLSSIGDFIYDSIEGGFLGSLGWGSMMLISSFLNEGFIKDKTERYYLLGGAVFSLIGISSSFIWGFSRFRLNSPFVFFSIGISAMFYYVFHLLFDKGKLNSKLAKKENAVSILGKNTFLIFIIHLFLINIIYLIIPSNANIYLAITFAIIICLISWIISYFLYKGNIYLIL